MTTNDEIIRKYGAYGKGIDDLKKCMDEARADERKKWTALEKKAIDRGYKLGKVEEHERIRKLIEDIDRTSPSMRSWSRKR